MYLGTFNLQQMPLYSSCSINCKYVRWQEEWRVARTTAAGSHVNIETNVAYVINTVIFVKFVVSSRMQYQLPILCAAK